MWAVSHPACNLPSALTRALLHTQVPCSKAKVGVGHYLEQVRVKHNFWWTLGDTGSIVIKVFAGLQGGREEEGELRREKLRRGGGGGRCRWGPRRRGRVEGRSGSVTTLYRSDHEVAFGSYISVKCELYI